MEGPPPPIDTNIRNIIEKLAEFVARNGPEFEAITKQKQTTNPKFQFLYGGEYAEYYRYRVSMEQLLSSQKPSSTTDSKRENLVGINSSSSGSENNGSSNNINTNTNNTIHHTVNRTSSLNTNPHLLLNIPNALNPPTVGIDTLDTFSLNPSPSVPPNKTVWNSNVQMATSSSNLGTNNTNQFGANLSKQLETAIMQQCNLREQIIRSEANLAAQRQALLNQQKKQIEDVIEVAQKNQLKKLAEENRIKFSEMDAILQPIIDSCTKDSISTGKNWILQHSADNAKINVVLQYLLKKAMRNGSTFQQKLHLIYLINDILHHCMRKKATFLQNSLENIVIPMFCSADLIATPSQRVKLSKLLSLWESKAKFFDACVMSKLQSPDSSMQEYKTNQHNQHRDLTEKLIQVTNNQLETFQTQHQFFIQHAMQQINQLEVLKKQLEQQILMSVLPPNHIGMAQVSQNSNIQSLMSQNISNPIMDSANDSNNCNRLFNVTTQGMNSGVMPSNFLIPDLSKPPPGFMTAQNIPVVNSNTSVGQNPLPILDNNVIAQNGNSHHLQQFAPQASQNVAQITNVPTIPMSINHTLHTGNGRNDILSLNINNPNQVAQQSNNPGIEIALQQMDSIPEMNFQHPVAVEIPKKDYYDLPAGLVVPLIHIDDYKYRTIDPESLRIPIADPLNDRISNAVLAFYALPTHDRPRDIDGWEKLGLYEYYKVKNSAKKQREEDIKNGIKEKSRSSSPLIIERFKPKKVNKRLYKSRSRSPSPLRLIPVRSRSSSNSPVSSTGSNSGNRERSTKTTSTRSSNTKQSSRSPQSSSSKEKERKSTTDIDEKNKYQEDNVSSPPISHPGADNSAKVFEFIEETNRGHQMLMKMGWAGTGTGLGVKGQGINQPILTDEQPRDRCDLYKGVGININDPFENFRKNKGAAFVHRMRSRDEKI